MNHATFVCADCAQEKPFKNRCPLPGEPTTYRCSGCLRDLHLALYREVDALADGPSKTSRLRYVETPVRTPRAVRGIAAVDAGKVIATLSRMFRGEVVVVELLDGGWFRWGGRTFPNPTSCAETICGYKVSGPAFFAKAARVAS